jgi:hypothetical protein
MCDAVTGAVRLRVAARHGRGEGRRNALSGEALVSHHGVDAHVAHVAMTAVVGALVEGGDGTDASVARAAERTIEPASGRPVPISLDNEHDCFNAEVACAGTRYAAALASAPGAAILDSAEPVHEDCREYRGAGGKCSIDTPPGSVMPSASGRGATAIHAGNDIRPSRCGSTPPSLCCGYNGGVTGVPP